ncbi:MAG: cell division protein FtsQ/DivIB [Pseudomonadota bacterium]
MRPLSAKVRRLRDPAPSRLRYRLTRIWLRPALRRAVNVGIPMVVGLLASWTVLSQVDFRGHALAAVEAVRGAVMQQPQFMIIEIAVPDVSDDLAEQIRVAAFLSLPVSSLEVSVASVRARIETLDAVERAQVRLRSNGVLEVAAVERVPVVVWRTQGGIQLLDADGIRVAEIDSRLRRPDLPLIVGRGAEAHVAEALALLEMAAPVAERVRGLARVGARRWDLVLDRGQVIRLPETGPDAALLRVLALHAELQLLDRDLEVVDWRNPDRPMLRISDHAVSEIERLREMSLGEDA